MDNPDSETDLKNIVRQGAACYFNECQERVDGFISQHFRYPGAWSTNRPALGWDLLRAPINLIWAPVYVTVMLFGWLARKAGWKKVDDYLRRIPSGFTTRVQCHIAELIDRDLLCRGGTDPKVDPLQIAITRALASHSGSDRSPTELQAELERVVSEALQQYRLTRTASADITNSVGSIILGAFAFKKFTPGGIAIGILFASWLAQRQAAEKFFLGDYLGGLYYQLFPPDPSLSLQLLGVIAVLCVLAVFASLSGLITDPIQSWTGLHRYRLNKMINSLQRDFDAISGSTFRPKDPYLARLLEIVDVTARV